MKRLSSLVILLSFLAIPFLQAASLDGSIYSQGNQLPVFGTDAAGKETTTLFRAVSPGEYEGLMKSGQFSAGVNSVEGKYFATTAADAAQWGAKFYGEGPFKIVSASVPKDAVKQFFYFEKLDNIGPAFFAELGQVNIPGLVVGTVK